MEQAIWSELGKVREQVQEVPNLYTLCEHLHEIRRPKRDNCQDCEVLLGR